MSLIYKIRQFNLMPSLFPGFMLYMFTWTPKYIISYTDVALKAIFHSLTFISK